MPSLSAYRLTWFSLTLDVWYLFTAAPAKLSHCSLSLLLTLDEVYLLMATPLDLECGVAPLGPPVPASEK